MNMRGGNTVPVIHVKVSNHDVGSGRNDQQEPTMSCCGREHEKSPQSGFLPVRTVPVLGLVLHVLLGLEPRTALPGTRAGGTSTVPVLAVLYLKWRISLILINLRFIFF